jgi:hypothetical protein
VSDALLRTAHLLPLLLIGGIAAAAAPATHLEVSTAVGYDANPLRLPESGEAAGFTQMYLDTGLTHDWTDRAGFFVRADGLYRAYGAAAQDADHGWADLRAGLTLTPYAAGPRRVMLAVGTGLGVQRSTYIDPATGEVFEAESGSAALVPVPERFDFDSARAFLNLGWALNRRVFLFLDSDYERRDFVEDYAHVDSLEPLDDRTITLEPGARVRLSPAALLDLSLLWADRRYDDLSALDEDAEETADTAREYGYSGFRIALRLAPFESWDLSVGVEGTDRHDRHAALGYSPTRTTRLRFFGSWRDVRYQNATVGGDPSGPRHGGELLRFVGTLEHTLGRRLTFFGEAGAGRSDDRDPVYAYRRTWAQTGVRFSL